MQNIIQIKLPQNPDNAPFVNTYLIKNQRILIDAGPANLQAYQILKQTLNDNQIDFNSLNIYHSSSFRSYWNVEIDSTNCSINCGSYDCIL